MKSRIEALYFALALILPVGLPLSSVLSTPAHAQQLQPKEGWYKELVDFDFVRANVDIPPKKGVTLIDSRPAARQYDPGHIPGAINIPDSQFEKLVDKLPADKGSLLVFYCGGLECMLSHNSAFKAEKLGYSNIKVYAAGMPDWKARGGPASVSAAYLKKLIDESGKGGVPYTLIDARPKRVADKGMIPTAINISDTDFDKNTDKLPADKASLVIYYCGGLECVLSDKSADKARKLGYSNVVTYPPGHPEWEKLHGAAPTSATTTPSGSSAAPATVAALAAGKEKGSVTVASFEKTWKDSPATINLVDVRDAKEFGASTIKGAINIPINDLEKKLDLLPNDKPTVFVCGTGARAGEAYDTVKLLRDKLPVHFLDAEVTFKPDGSFNAKQK